MKKYKYWVIEYVQYGEKVEIVTEPPDIESLMETVNKLKQDPGMECITVIKRKDTIYLDWNNFKF